MYCCSTGGGGGGSNNIGINAANCGKVSFTAQSPASPEAAFGEFPWQVLLYAKPNIYVGGGALITSMHVLTATHKIIPYR